METNGYFVQAWEALSPLAEIWYKRVNTRYSLSF